VYTAEHYVVDILLGWALAAAVLAIAKYFGARRLKPKEEDAEVPLSSSV
jgi:hypothetical protein